MNQTIQSGKHIYFILIHNVSQSIGIYDNTGLNMDTRQRNNTIKEDVLAHPLIAVKKFSSALQYIENNETIAHYAIPSQCLKGRNYTMSLASI